MGTREIHLINIGCVEHHCQFECSNECDESFGFGLGRPLGISVFDSRFASIWPIWLLICLTHLTLLTSWLPIGLTHLTLMTHLGYCSIWSIWPIWSVWPMRHCLISMTHETLSDQYDPWDTAKTSNPIPSGSSDLFDPSSPSASCIHMCMSYQQSLLLVPVSEWSGQLQGPRLGHMFF